MIRLRLFHREDPSRQIDSRVLGEGDTSVGRGIKADWQIADPERDLSRLHMTLTVRDGMLTVRDTSANGVFVGTPRARLEHDRPTPVSRGESIAFGPYVAVAEEDAAARLPSAPILDDDPFDGGGPDPARTAARDPFGSALRPDPVRLDEEPGDGVDAWERRREYKAGDWDPVAPHRRPDHSQLIGTPQGWAEPPAPAEREHGLGFDAPFTSPILREPPVAGAATVAIPSDWDAAPNAATAVPVAGVAGPPSSSTRDPMVADPPTDSFVAAPLRADTFAVAACAASADHPGQTDDPILPAGRIPADRLTGGDTVAAFVSVLEPAVPATPADPFMEAPPAAPNVPPAARFAQADNHLANVDPADDPILPPTRHVAGATVFDKAALSAPIPGDPAILPVAPIPPLADEAAPVRPAPILPPPITPAPGSFGRGAIPPTGEGAPPPITATAPQPSADDALFASFCAGARLNPDAFAGEDRLALMERLGAVYRQAILGVADLMGERTALKNDFRMVRTTIRPQNNNPFKWVPPQRIAIELLRTDDGSGYSTGEAALNEALHDVKAHLLCVLAGMRGAIGATFDLLSPSEIEARTANRGFVMPGQRNAAAWAEYVEQFETQRREADDSAEGPINRAFRDAYEEQARALDGG